VNIKLLTDLSLDLLGVLFYLFLYLIRQLVQLTLGELQQLALLLKLLLTLLPVNTIHARKKDN